MLAIADIMEGESTTYIAGEEPEPPKVQSPTNDFRSRAE